MIRQINHNPLLLSQKAKVATPADQATITDLLDTLRANAQICVGMAANMIGVNKRLIVVSMGMMPVAMVNPEIIAKSSPFSTKEGCLSLEGQRPTTRYRQITVRYLDRQFNAHQQAFSGWIAQIIQHEVDHCDGILI